MTVYGVGGIGPPTGAPPLQGDPFKDHPNAGIYMSVDSSGNHVAQVIPDVEAPTNIQNFNSGAVGNPSAEQIWAFKARQLAANIDLLRGLIANMEATVPPGRNNVWGAGATQLAADLGTVQNHVANLCNATATPKP